MNREETDAILRRTLEDRKMSRGERGVLREILGELDLGPDERDRLRSRIFAFAAEAMRDPHDREILDWVADAVGLLKPAAPPARPVEPPTAHFSPEDDCVGRILELFRGARRTVDVCVFTITDDRIGREIERAHERGVRIRIVSDDDKAHDEGSDAHALAAAGVPVAFDRSEFHMHHKYAIFDGRRLLTGSYNWTRSAAAYNEENFLVTADPVLVGHYQRQFDRLWSRFAAGSP